MPTTFRVYDDALTMIREIRSYRILIAREDPDQAQQLRRASKAVALHIAEARGSRGRNQQARYHTALGEARETLANLEVAVADGIVESIDPMLADRLDRIIGSLVKLSRASHQQ
jgi:four helix bundle protein